MADDDPTLTPEQEKKIERIQVIGVASIALCLVATNILLRAEVIAFWKLLVVFLGVEILIAVLGTMAVSRVQQRPFAEVLRRSTRGSITQLKASPQRLRARVSAGVQRLRGR